ncbi:MAG TPA: DUF1844 domain-containing protein [Candidatus Limnocylindrales bacterium]|nr:DUF1844 domain-containing protein [Candidatus Limnocylindrales bacterium]
MNESKNEGPTPDSASLSERNMFLGLVQSFQSAAMQQLGKVMNPFTQKIERDMAHAKLSIEMLQMLKTRTSGNLTTQEGRFLDHVLTELRLNFVAETERDNAEPAKGGASGPGQEDAPEPPS